MELHYTYDLASSTLVTMGSLYSLRPKMIVWLSAQLEIEAQSQTFLYKTFYIKKSFTLQLPGTFRSSCCFLFSEAYLQLFNQWSTGLNLAQLRNTDNHFGTEESSTSLLHYTYGLVSSTLVTTSRHDLFSKHYVTTR